MRLSLRTANKSTGFVLVITVVIVALLTIMAVAFLSSATSERATSRASANKSDADLAAKTAVNVATARFTSLITSFPDSATTWESINQATSGIQYQGTTVYYRDQTPEATAAGTPSALHALPLISGAEPVTIPYGAQTATARETTLRAALPALNSTNSYDLNHARFSGDVQGWIGAPPSSASRPEFRAQWINLTNSDGKVSGRYAYWMEDESFKVNANLMGNTLRGSGSLGNAPSQIPFQGIFKTVLASTDPDTIANDTITLRTKFPTAAFFEYRALNQVTGQPILADSLKFEATINSGASNLSRSGAKRVNLNKIVVDQNPDPTNSTAVTAAQAAIRKQLDQIIKTISYQLPNFGQRFYRAGTNRNSLDVPDTSGSAHRTIYLNKIAANIRDYIDTDSQPTIVNNDGDPTTTPPKPFTVRIGTAPAHPIETSGGGTAGPSEVIAIGKERVPFVQEYVLRVREITFGPRTGAFANYTISIDHYVEFWNTSNRDILVSALGPNPFLLIADQPGWDAGGLSDIAPGAGRDIKLPLSSAKNASTNASLTSFPAGSVTVITTDLQPLSSNGSSTPVQTGPLTPDLTRVYICPVTPASLRTYSGQTQKKSGSELRLNLITRTTTQTDYETEIVLGNDLGILESAWGAGDVTSALSVNIDNTTPAENRLDDTKYHFRGASLRGNASAPAATANATAGDPRTNAEQINFDLNGSTASNDKTRYFDTGLDSSHIPANSSLGAPNSFYVNPAIWPDPSSSAQSATAAPGVIANANITSIGQLGDIFDPVRTKGDSNNILLSRSGGRTLKIGQSDRFDATTNTVGLWDGSSSTASREWAAWRLADVFSTNDLVQLDGRININGVGRDGGAALKAALYGYTFQATPDSDANLSGKNFDADPTDSADKINVLVSQIQARLKNDQTAYGAAFVNTAGPFAERGELSEMPMFNTGTDLVSSVNTASANDRGREELFRRMAELITTRGSIFTVYAVGQSLIPQAATATPIVTSTSQLKVTFRIDPVWNAGTPADPSWDPATTTRFSKPDRYEIKVLYAGE
jgi:Tfp pilus assembly protein FimT